MTNVDFKYFTHLRCFDPKTDTFEVPTKGMICGLSEQASIKYTMTEEPNGLMWMVGANVPDQANYVYCGSPKYTGSEGFGGRWLTFELVDGKKIKLQGPWHSNADALFDHTGVDVRDRHYTFVVVSRKLKHPLMSEILWIDPMPMLGERNRHKQICENLLERGEEDLFYYNETKGGSVTGPYTPEYHPGPPTTK